MNGKLLIASRFFLFKLLIVMIKVKIRRGRNSPPIERTPVEINTQSKVSGYGLSTPDNSIGPAGDPFRGGSSQPRHAMESVYDPNDNELGYEKRSVIEQENCDCLCDSCAADDSNKGNPDLDGDGVYAPSELYYHFDLDSDGVVTPEEYKDHVVWHAENPEVFEINEEGLSEKKDRCYRLAKQKYKVFPSAYASGFIVRCRKGKVGRKKKNEEIELELDIGKILKEQQEDLSNTIFVMKSPYAPKTMKYDHIGFVLQDGSLKDMSGHRYTEDGSEPMPPMNYNFEDTEKLFNMPDNKEDAIKRGLYKEKKLPKTVSVPSNVACNLKDPKEKSENCGSFVKIVLKNNGISTTSSNMIEDIFNSIKQNIEEGTFDKEKSQGLHGWFARQGGKGKSKGWVDCRTCRTNPETGRKTCKSCGRQKGEKRSGYPACRPTPSACNRAGTSKKKSSMRVSWKKKKQE